MTPGDWYKVLSEWRDSQACLFSDNLEEGSFDGNRFAYIYEVGKGTAKARFFMVDDGINGNYGFWCPKSAILGFGGPEHEKYVVVARWCGIKIIEHSGN